MICDGELYLCTAETEPNGICESDGSRSVRHECDGSSRSEKEKADQDP